MRYQGRITSWKDEKGCGFISPNGGGEPVFAHIKSFSNRSRRPVGNEIVTYSLAHDEKGRPRAEAIAFVGAPVSVSHPAGLGKARLYLATGFLAIVVMAAYRQKLPVAVPAVYLLASALAFLAYVFDKSAAKRDERRTSENTLHVLSLAGGWPGALMAQHWARHKTRKQPFQFLFWCTVVLNCGFFVWWYFPLNAWPS